MDLLSETLTFPFTTTRHPVAVPILTLAGSTAHQVATALEAPFPIHFWQALIILLQTK